MNFKKEFQIWIFIHFFCLVLSADSSRRVPPNYLDEFDFHEAHLLPNTPGERRNHFDQQRDNIPIQSTRNFLRNGPWPNAKVPYVIDSSFTNEERAAVAKAINEYHTKTCVRFVAKQARDVDYVNIMKDEKACGWSDLCRTGGPQYLKFGTKCTDYHTITHEMGHTICFDHEMNRYDSSKYLTFDEAKCGGQYPIDSEANYTTMDLLYDYTSVMHYFHICLNGCAVPKLPGKIECGTQGGLSVLDAEKINAFYNCGGCYGYRFRPIKKLSSSDNLVPIGNGYYGGTLYTCRVYHDGAIVPGSYDPQNKDCRVTKEGKEYPYYEDFEVLTNPKRRGANLQWKVHKTGDPIPPKSISGGRDYESWVMYIARCTLTFEGGKSAVYPAKFYDGKATVGFYDNEYDCEQYELLVCQ